MRRRERESGLTLIELLLTLALLALALAALYGFFFSGLFTWRKGVVRMDQQQSARAAIDLVDRELRFADWVKIESGGAEIRYKFSSDPYHESEQYFRRFRLSGEQLLLETVLGGSVSSSNVAAGGISAVSFEIDGSNNVHISITAGSGEGAVTLQSSVRPRNLPKPASP